MVRDLDGASVHIYLAFEYRRVMCPRCNAVKQERISWLALSKRYTQRFEDYIGRQCREMSIKRVAELNGLSWDQVQRMEMAYMQRLLAQQPAPSVLRAIGIDEISVRKRHRYTVVVADLDRQRPIWLGGSGRTEDDLALFYREIGPALSNTIGLAVMDMWKPFRKATNTHAPNARIVFDKFHIIRHLANALDQVRRSEYKRVNDKERKYIKGKRYTLLSNKANLDEDGRNALDLLLKANKRLNKAYLLKESFGQLWDYNDDISSRTFFDNWKRQLRYSRLESYKKFAAMIERHWDGIVSYAHPDNKVALGFMEGLNNKIRVIQRRAYGIKSTEYLRLKVLTSFLKEQEIT